LLAENLPKYKPGFLPFENTVYMYVVDHDSNENIGPACKDTRKV